LGRRAGLADAMETANTTPETIATVPIKSFIPISFE
jgi:hypothetical protein